MPQNRLILRQTASPFTFPLPDIVKGSVLSWDEVDGNFIFLKGLDIQSASVVGSDIVFNRINGNTFSVDVSSLTGGTTTTDVFVTGGTYNDLTGDATFVNNTGGTFTVTGFTTGVSSGGYVNNIIPSGTTITVPQNQQYIVYGNLDHLERILFHELISSIDVSKYKDARVIIKGCSDLPVPNSAYVDLTNKLTPVVKSLMFGEPCSTVPLYKKK